MTIDEAIKRFSQEAEVCEGNADNYTRNKQHEFAAVCAKEATENRQLAEWLTELLQRREQCAQYEVEQISNLEQYDMLSREYEILNGRYKEAIRLLKTAVEDTQRLLSRLHI